MKKITFNTLREELKQLIVEDNAFQIWLATEGFESVEDFETSYTSEDVHNLIDYLDIKELKENKSFYKII